MDTIKQFKGKYSFLSNFYPCMIYVDGVMYPSVEHAFQASKTENLEERRLFRVCSSKDAKNEGKLVTLRANWDTMKLDLMYSLLKQKFSDPHLKASLLSTSGKELIEGNTWGDEFWGVCKSKGENNLGKLLMKLREELKS